jgi:hypothetical protein
MSRKGVARRVPFLMMRMRPPFSTMKSRLLSPGGVVRKTGKSMPVTTFCNPKEIGRVVVVLVVMVVVVVEVVVWVVGSSPHPKYRIGIIASIIATAL